MRCISIDATRAIDSWRASTRAGDIFAIFFPLTRPKLRIERLLRHVTDELAIRGIRVIKGDGSSLGHPAEFRLLIHRRRAEEADREFADRMRFRRDRVGNVGPVEHLRRPPAVLAQFHPDDVAV